MVERGGVSDKEGVSGYDGVGDCPIWRQQESLLVRRGGFFGGMIGRVVWLAFFIRRRFFLPCGFCCLCCLIFFLEGCAELLDQTVKAYFADLPYAV